MQHSAAAGSALWLAAKVPAKGQSPNEKLNIGIIGVANQGRYNLDNVRGENIVALCDVDDNLLNAAWQEFPQARIYRDFRKLLELNALDAVVISTPDHIHAPATLMALQSGRHVYCEKPLTHTVAEARRVAETARRYKRVTQMGTQIHAGSNYRRVVERIQSGAIGKVGEVHVWLDTVYTGNGRPAETPPVPPNLHWNLWLGPAPVRPYHPAYLPFWWRQWWDFGGGTLADMACHWIDLPHWALNLRHPVTIEAEGPPLKAENTPEWLIVRYEYPARDGQPPVKLTWYNSGKRPALVLEGKVPNWGAGTLFVGEKGMLLSDYGKHILLPEKEFAGFQPPAPSIPDSIGHHQEWIHACKTGATTTCNFDYAGALTEAVLLGNVAYRTGNKLTWDAVNLKAVGCPEADSFLHPVYRKGWKV
jgi:predicted dehydrogenase